MDNIRATTHITVTIIISTRNMVTAIIITTTITTSTTIINMIQKNLRMIEEKEM